MKNRPPLILFVYAAGIALATNLRPPLDMIQMVVCSILYAHRWVEWFYNPR